MTTFLKQKKKADDEKFIYNQIEQFLSFLCIIKNQSVYFDNIDNKDIQKNHNQIQMLDSETGSITLQGIEDSQVPTLKCIGGIEAHQVCLNRNCKEQQAIICNASSCQCLKLHKFCFRTSIASVIEIIQEKAYALKNIEEKINKIFENAVDRLSQTRDKFIQIYHNLFKTKSYFPFQRDFLNEVNSNQGKKLTGLMTSQIYDSVYIREQLDKKIVKSGKKIDEFNQKFNTQFDQFGRSVQKQLLYLQQNIVGSKVETVFNFHMMKKSQIVNSFEDQEKLMKLFPSKFEKIELLYVSSQHQFSGQAFHKLCDDKQNIFILIRTKHDKIIGAYTPYGLHSTNKNIWTQDSNYQCFIFSLTEGVKLKLRKNLYAYINFSSGNQHIVKFGEDLKIADFANKKQTSTINFYQDYQSNFYQNNSEGYTKFTGSEKSQFLIDEMEVWKIN